MYCTWYGATFSSPLISTEICNRIAPDTADLSVRFSKLYHTSISPDNVRTSMMVWPRKSSDSRVSFCRSFDFKSLSSSQTRTFIRSDELWHSLLDIHPVWVRVSFMAVICVFIRWRAQLNTHRESKCTVKRIIRCVKKKNTKRRNVKQDGKQINEWTCDDKKKNRERKKREKK